MRQITVKAFCVLYDADRTHHLVWVGSDPARGPRFHRLLGGHVEFGERAADAVVREIAEEAGAAVAPRFLGVVEQIFEYEGRPGHEVVFVYAADMPTPSPIGPEGGFIDDNGVAIPCVWRAVDDRSCPLFPDAVQRLIDADLAGLRG